MKGKVGSLITQVRRPGEHNNYLGESTEGGEEERGA